MGTVPQAGAIPWRRMEGGDGGWKLQILTITSTRGNWIFPKGMIDPGDSSKETAIKELEEEAGFTGRISGPAVGAYRYSKWGLELEVTMYPVEVTGAAEVWEEAGHRQLFWGAPERVRDKLHKPELRELLDRFLAERL